jgi:hypothetical protein
VKTGFPDVDGALSMLVPGIHAALGERLVGLYIFGSVAHREYDAGVSDADILAVVDRPLEPSDLPALERMHAAAARALPEWDDRVETLYVSTEALRTFREKATPIAVVSPGELLNIKPAGIEWLMNWWDVREHGLTLFGPASSTFIPEISRQEFVASIRSYAGEFPARLNESLSEKWQAYLVLTMCRSLYTSVVGETASKKHAAAWAVDRYPGWEPLIRASLAARVAFRDGAIASLPRRAEIAAFVDFALRQIR